MDPWLRNLGGTFIIGLAAVLVPRAAEAQVVFLRTVPLPAGEQFLVTPTQTLGMGNPSFAVTDAWGDPFVNPARGARNERLRLFALPTFYGADGSSGGGASLPFAVLGRSGRTFGGAALAFQAADDPNAAYYWNNVPNKPAGLGAPVNRYGSVLLGRVLGDGRTSFGLGVSAAHLEAVSAVERLYSNRTWLAQSGRTLEVRAGVLRELGGGRSIEALLLNSRGDLKYDVGRVAWSWMNNTPSTQNRYWVDHNRDRSNIWGAHVRYVGSADSSGWRPAVIATVNRKTYPSLPDYDIAPVPRDPGESWAFQAGIGTSRVTQKRTIVYEIALEPAWTHTWANSAPDSLGSPIVRTSENWLHFIDGHALAGMESRTSWGAWQAGLRIDEVHYSLSRQVFTGTGRDVDTGSSWLEWTPTWGFGVHAGMAELRYTGHITFKGGIAGESKVIVTPANSGGSDYVPPAINASDEDFWSAAHQFTVSIPLGKR